MTPALHATRRNRPLHAIASGPTFDTFTIRATPPHTTTRYACRVWWSEYDTQGERDGCEAKCGKEGAA